MFNETSTSKVEQSSQLSIFSQPNPTKGWTLCTLLDVQRTFCDVC